MFSFCRFAERFYAQHFNSAFLQFRVHVFSFQVVNTQSTEIITKEVIPYILQQQHSRNAKWFLNISNIFFYAAVTLLCHTYPAAVAHSISSAFYGEHGKSPVLPKPYQQCHQQPASSKTISATDWIINQHRFAFYDRIVSGYALTGEFGGISNTTGWSLRRSVVGAVV